MSLWRKWHTLAVQSRYVGGSSPLRDTTMRAWRNGRRIRFKPGTTKGSSPFAPTKYARVAENQAYAPD